MASEKQLSTGTPAMDHVLSVIDGFKATMVVQAACKLELFDRLADQGGSSSVDQLASRNDWDNDATERLLNALVSLQLVHKAANANGEYMYSVTDAGQYLRRNAAVNVWDYTQTLERFFTGLKQLPDEVKTGKNKATQFPHHVAVHKPEPEAEKADDAPHGHGHHQHHGGKKMPVLDRYRMYEGMGQPYVRAMATAFDIGHHKRVVDLGGGSGTLAFELSRVYPGMEVTLFEVPVVIELVREHFLPADKKDLNVTLVAGDFFENALPSADLYILSKVVHDWSTEQTTTLLKKVADNLQKGGGIILMEKCLNDEKDGPVSGHVWDLLVMAHCAGKLRSGKEYRELLSSVGFTDIQIAKTQGQCSTDVIYGRKA